MEEAQKGNFGCNHHDYSPFYFLKEAVNAILKCLGLESSSSEEEKNKFTSHHHQQSCKDDQSSSSSSSSCSSDGEKTVSLPSTETDPSTNDPPPIEDLASRGRTPPRPPVSGGPNPQTNSNPSS